MKAILVEAETTSDCGEYTYLGSSYGVVLGPSKIHYLFKCFNSSLNTEFSLDLNGTGLPVLKGSREYEIEIKITEIPKPVPVEYIIK